MIQQPVDVAARFPVRKTKKKKQLFRDAVCAYGQRLGYPVTVEKGSLGSRNVVFGDPDAASVLVTAHYDTCARMLIPNWITPCSLLPFLGWQLLLIVLIGLASAALSLLEALVLAGIAALFGANLGDAWILFAGLAAPGFLWINVLLMLALMLIGPANPSNANDNTSGVVALLEIMATMPENQRQKVCFVLFDLEEAGLIGSASYRKAHSKASDRQMVLNLDCVGEGDQLMMFPTKQLKKNRRKLTGLYTACGYFGKKCLTVREKGFSVYPSDQMNFPYGVGICALKKGKLGLQIGKIHTPKDDTLDMTNINILRAALVSYICCAAAQ